MKTNFLTRIANGCSRLWSALKSHPVELLILLHVTLVAFFYFSDHSTWYWWQQPAPYAAIATTAAFCLSRFRKGKNWAQWSYFAILPLYALTVFLPEACPKTTEFAILNILLPAIYMLTLPDDFHFSTFHIQFHERFYRIIRSNLIALGIALILFILLILINGTLELLFSLTQTFNRFLEISSCFCFIFLAPMIFISLESQKEQPKVIRLVEVVVNYVFTPVLLVYNLILYVYLAVIVVKWELPQSSVSTMVMAFTVVAIAIRLVRPLLSRQPLRWYFRWFALFALPLVVLFWVAVGYRVGQYGLTVDRCLLLVSGALMTLYLIGTLVFDSRKSLSAHTPDSIFNYGFTALIVLCGIVLAFGGPLSARQVSLRSQTAIVREKATALGILTPEGTFDTTTFHRSESDSTGRKDYRIIYQSMKYIESDLSDTTAIRASLGLTSAEYLDRLSPTTARYAECWWIDDENERLEVELEVEEVSSCYLSDYHEENLDISGYSRILLAPDCDRNPKTIPYPGGNINADTLLATQLAKIGYSLNSNIDCSRLEENEETLLHYQSPDGSILIIFEHLEIDHIGSLNQISSATIRCALTR